jgi:hypothetical protein
MILFVALEFTGLEVAHGAAPYFVGTGINQNFYIGIGMSSNGRYVVGNDWRGQDTSRFYEDNYVIRWTQDADPLVLDINAFPAGVSDDGSVIVGSEATSRFVSTPFRWTVTGGMEYITPGSEGHSTATDVSSDGNTVVGYLDLPSPPPASLNTRWELFRWTTNSGFQRLGNLTGDLATSWVAYLGSAAPSPQGDYNASGTVDAADYVVWRNSVGQTGAGLAADGDASGTIDAGDYNLWRAHFGQTVGAASRAALNSTPGRGPAAPEPTSAALVFVGIVSFIWSRRSRITPATTLACPGGRMFRNQNAPPTKLHAPTPARPGGAVFDATPISNTAPRRQAARGRDD